MRGCTCSLSIFIYYDDSSSDIAACSEYAWLSITILNSFLCSPSADGLTMIIGNGTWREGSTVSLNMPHSRIIPKMFSIETIRTPKAKGLPNTLLLRREYRWRTISTKYAKAWRYRAVLLTTVRSNPAKFQRFVRSSRPFAFVCTVPRAACKTSSMGFRKIKVTMTEKMASVIKTKATITAPTAIADRKSKMLTTIVIPNKKIDQSAIRSKRLSFFFTRDDKCAYFPNERRIQILEGKPVFPHDGRRNSYTVTDFTLKKVKRETVHLHKTVHLRNRTISS
jgi:hypothetical protein